MLSRRRARVRAAPQGGAALGVVLWLVAAAAAGLGYVQLSVRVRALAREVAAAEEALVRQRQFRLNEEGRWAQLCALKPVRAALQQFGIAMDWAGSERMVYLVREVAAPAPAATGETRWARVRREP
ncbi:MAG: hypothetical protein N2652_09285 [Kiritimatiellae bacterium]|nr:hypothetical protein [Kiritimatiellia bacterium]